MKKILIVGSTHGHEKIGQYVHEELKKILPENSGVEMIIGNPRASDLNVAFIESDLNRVFPGKELGTYEEMRAFELSPKIKSADVVIDIHSTNTTDYSKDSMLILSKLDEDTKKLVDIINPPKVLIMTYKNDSFSISQAKIGLGFEYGIDSSKKVLEAILYDIANVLIHFKIIDKNPYKNIKENIATETFEVYDICERNFTGSFKLTPEVNNFKLVKEGQVIAIIETGEKIQSTDDFYPIMFGENRYTNMFGFKARKI